MLLPGWGIQNRKRRLPPFNQCNGDGPSVAPPHKVARAINWVHDPDAGQQQAFGVVRRFF